MRSVPDSDAVMAQCAGEEGRSLSDLLASYPGHEEHVTRVWLAAHADRVPSEPFASADRSGPYERLRLVGRGAQGEVFLARDVRTQRRVALKILSGSPGPHAIARLRHEARAIARLRHPGIAELLDADLDSESPWLALRYVEGTALRDARTDPVCPVALFALPGQPLPNGFLRWFEQLARAVHAAHEAGVVHADLHPGNVIIAAHGDPVILDFGTAKVEGLASITSTGVALGSAQFAAPEVLRGRRADRRADVFSLGAMMRNCLSLTAGEAYQPTATDPVVKGLGAVLGKATAAAATDRFATALDLAAELRRLRVGESVLTGRAGPIARAMQRILRNRWPVTAAVLLTALLATALISWSDTLRARRRSDAAAERGSALLANLAENWGTSRQADLTAAGSVRSDHATSEGLAARIDLEVGRILRRAGQVDAARERIDLAAHDATTATEACLESALLAFERGAPVAVPDGIVSPVRQYVAALRMLQQGLGTDAIPGLRDALAHDDWPAPSLRDECRALACWLAIDEGHAAAESLLADLHPAEPGVHGALARMLLARSLLLAPEADVEVTLAALQRARADLARNLGDGHEWVLRTERAIAVALALCGDLSYALQVCEGLEPRQCELHGVGHTEVSRTRVVRLACMVRRGDATAARELASVSQTGADRSLLDRLVPAGAPNDPPPVAAAPDRHIEDLRRIALRAEARSRELWQEMERTPLAAQEAFSREQLATHRFSVEFPAHSALLSAAHGESSPQHLESLLNGMREMATDHRDVEALRVARWAKAIALRHPDDVDPIISRLIDCWFVRLTFEERQRVAGGASVIARSSDLVANMRASVDDLRRLCGTSDERFQSALKALADLLGNDGDTAGAAQALEVYEELRRLAPERSDRALWCAEAAFGAGNAERLEGYLDLTERLLGERPAYRHYQWVRLDELRRGLLQLRQTSTGR